MGRQRELERCGWQFARVLESDFVRDPAQALAPVWDRLAELDIHPSGWTPPVDEDVVPEEPVAENDVGENDVGELPDDVEPLVDDITEELSAEPPPATGAVDQAEPGLDAYVTFSGSVVPADSATTDDVIDGLVRIVEVEGPIVGHRLHTVYVRASGGQRVGPQIARTLNRALSTAKRRGVLLQDDPLGETGVKPATFRVPGQPEVRLRDIGPRDFDHVPPAELAELMRRTAEQVGSDDQAHLFRETAAHYGIRRVGSGVRARLLAVLTTISP